MVNKVILIGNVGIEPEVRALETGVKMARLRIATTERIYNSSTGEKREHTEWHTIVLWRGQADFAEKYIHKGSQVYVEGKIRSREWTEEATGNKRYSVEILADEIRLLGQRRNDSNYGNPGGTPGNNYGNPGGNSGYAGNSGYGSNTGYNGAPGYGNPGSNPSQGTSGNYGHSGGYGQAGGYGSGTPGYSAPGSPSGSNASGNSVPQPSSDVDDLPF